MNEFIDHFLNYLQTEKDAAKSAIHKYKADLEIYLIIFKLMTLMKLI